MPRRLYAGTVNGPTSPASPRRNKAIAIAISAALLAIVIATAALVVGIIGLIRPTTSAVSVAGTSSPPARSAPVDITAANQVLCGAIAPLMAEGNRVSKALSSQAPAGSPGWNAAIPKFISDEKDLLGRLQPIIDSHPDVDRYFHRTLQRYVDDRRNLVADLEAGPWQPYDQNIWDDSLRAYNGPLVTCWDLGVKWSG